jgi:hypothetical protein
MAYQRAGKVAILAVVCALTLTVGGVKRAWGRQAEKSQAGEAAARTERSPSWPPPNVDDEVPPLAPDVPCSLPEVLEGVSENLKLLIANLREFSATERLVHQQYKGNGRWENRETRTYEYLVDLHESADGLLLVDEYRSGSGSALRAPAELQDRGLPALVLVFHPQLRDDYEMKCEGLGQWQGQPAWLVHFELRPDRTSRLRSFVVGHLSYPVRLKGRAWISKDTYQVLRLESDLLTAIPQIRLFVEHTVVEYRAVRFQRSNLELWLPAFAEIYMDFRGHRYHRLHSFSDFQLFSVDVQEKVNEPKRH